MRAHQFFTPSFLLTITIFSWLTMGCPIAGDGIREGNWAGDRVQFQFRDGELADIRVTGISCNGSSSCFAEFLHVNPAFSAPVSGRSFQVLLAASGGDLTLAGTFKTATFVEGTYEFAAIDGCCTTQGTWRAEFLAPFAQPDAVPQDDSFAGDLRQNDDAIEPPPGDEWPASATPEQIQAIKYTNALRDALDLPHMVQIEAINLAAQAHAEYFETHCGNYQQSNLSPHSENSAWAEGYSGTQFSDRMVSFGYQGIPGWEVMAFQGNAVQAIDGWVATLYHRIPFVHPAAGEMGFGTVKGGCYNWSSGTDVMDFGRVLGATSAAPIAYPYDGQDQVVPGWGGYESPQPPLPSGSAYPSGPIITLTFPNTGFTISGHELLDPAGNPVAHMYVDPQSDPVGFLSQTIALYALDPLAGFTTYTVRIIGTWKGQDQTWEWSFTTGPESDWYM